MNYRETRPAALRGTPWLVLGILAMSLLASTAQAEEPRWQPGDGVLSSESRTGPDFLGMTYLFPLRLHLSRGGYVDGGLGGVDALQGRMLLVLQNESLPIAFPLIARVTPLGRLSPDPALRLAEPPGLRSDIPVKYRWQPTWRSHLGVLLSFVVPGAGQFIQERDQPIGFLFLGAALSSVGVGLLALYGPSSYTQRSRHALGGLFFGLAGTVAVGAAVHAHRTGRERRPVDEAR